MAAQGLKRFYEEVRVVERAGAYAVSLGSRPLNTPLRTPLLVPTKALAEAIAEEWRAQEREINPAAMPLNRLVNSAFDQVSAARGAVEKEVVSYAASDLLCYWAEGPDDLVARQQRTWQPLLDWAEHRFASPFRIARGVIPVSQPDETLTAVRAAAQGLDSIRLTALSNAMTVAGSAILAFALLEGRLDAEGVWQAAQLDESWQREQWGDVAEAQAPRARRREMLEAAARCLQLLDVAA